MVEAFRLKFPVLVIRAMWGYPDARAFISPYPGQTLGTYPTSAFYVQVEGLNRKLAAELLTDFISGRLLIQFLSRTPIKESSGLTIKIWNTMPEIVRPRKVLFHRDFAADLAACPHDPRSKRAAFLVWRLRFCMHWPLYKTTRGSNQGWRRSPLGGGSNGCQFYL
jgi:hypothetical protein